MQFLYLGSYFIRRDKGPEIEFIIIMLWESLDAIRAFAGPNYEVAVVPDQRREHLFRWPHSAHYDVISQPFTL